tara:strand:- start:42959 stop:43378 length:420 start_codon:yes stop_codon:yes gene_type:complete
MESKTQSGDIRQLKLSTGAEIICEVLDDQKGHLVMRHALALSMRQAEDGYKYFTFGAFMIYQLDPLQVILLQEHHIVSFAIPSDDMIEQYNLALDEIEKERIRDLEEDNMSEAEEYDMTIDELLDKNIIDNSDTKDTIH